MASIRIESKKYLRLITFLSTIEFWWKPSIDVFLDVMRWSEHLRCGQAKMIADCQVMEAASVN